MCPVPDEDKEVDRPSLNAGATAGTGVHAAHAEQ